MVKKCIVRIVIKLDSVCKKKRVDINENLIKTEIIESFLCMLTIGSLLLKVVCIIFLFHVFYICSWLQEHESVTVKLSVYRIWSLRRQGLLSLCPWHKAQAWIVSVK